MVHHYLKAGIDARNYGYRFEDVSWFIPGSAVRVQLKFLFSDAMKIFTHLQQVSLQPLQLRYIVYAYSETERQREKERLAAIAIQTNWRMLKVKWNFKKKVRACVLISRVFRGHIARLRVDGTKQNRN